MRYMLLLYETDRDPSAPAFEATIGAHGAFIDDCTERGAFLAAGALRPVQTATSVRVRDGETLITDGPYTETREWFGGYYLLDCRDLDEALELAAKCPVAHNGTVEVRPIHEGIMARIVQRRQDHEREVASR
jgi:hypothetical protein